MIASHKTILFLLFIGIWNTSYTQDTKQYVPSHELVSIADSLSSAEQYDIAIATYKKIYQGDSNYPQAILGLVRSYNNQRNFNQVEHFALLGISLQNDLSIQHYIILGSNYFENKLIEKSIKLLTSGIKAYPMNAELLFLRSKAYRQSNKLELAIKDLQSSLTRNPYCTEAHFEIGKMAYNQGHFTQALFAYNAALLTNSNNHLIIKELNTKFSFSPESILKESSFSNNNFLELDQIIKSNISLESKSDINKSLSQPFIKQTLNAFKLLSERSLTTDFWDTFYIPFFNKLIKESHQEDMIYFIFRNDPNSKVSKVIAKNQVPIKKFANFLDKNWLPSHSILIEHGKAKDISWSNDNTIVAVGKIVDSETIGTFKYYSSNGRLSKTGHFDQDGERIRTWYFYHQNGNLKLIKHYEDGDNSGTDSVFYDNKVLKHTYIYNDGQLEGQSIWRYPNEVVFKSEYFKHNQLNGPVQEFSKIGNIQAKYSYQDNLKSDSIQMFEEDGSLRTETPKELPDGYFYSSYPNEQVKTEGFYVNNKKEGLWRSYYSNGKEREICFYSNGVKNGPQTSYLLNSDRYITYYYEHGFINAIELDNNETDKSQHLFVGLDSTTYKLMDNQTILVELTAKAKVLHGPFTQNYSSGKPHISGKYWNMKKHGNWITYFENGTVASTYSFYYGKPIGVWINYNPDGSVLNELKY